MCCAPVGRVPGLRIFQSAPLAFDLGRGFSSLVENPWTSPCHTEQGQAQRRAESWSHSLGDPARTRTWVPPWLAPQYAPKYLPVLPCCCLRRGSGEEMEGLNGNTEHLKSRNPWPSAPAGLAVGAGGLPKAAGMTGPWSVGHLHGGHVPETPAARA